MVNGASGGVGTFAVQIAKALGASHVTAVCSTANVETAARIGADRVVDYTREDATATGERYDVLFDNAGVWPLRTCGRLLADGGTYVMVTAPKSRWVHPLPRMLANPLYFAFTSGRHRGFKVASRSTDDLELLRDLAEQGSVRPVMSRRFTLDEAPEALRVQGQFHEGGPHPISRGVTPMTVARRSLLAGRHSRGRSRHRRRRPVAGRGEPATPRGPVVPSHRPFPPLDGRPGRHPGAARRASGTAIVTRAGETQLDDGQGPTPSDHDGTAVFNARRNRLHLIQNHELGAGAELGVPHVEGTVYDPGAVDAGGCTVIATDNAGNNHGEWVGISGTLTNCAGGPTPWGTWLTCEETETKKSTLERNGKSGTSRRTTATSSRSAPTAPAPPSPIKAFGRYAHEALAIDKDRTHIYLSEDASSPNGLFYRWTAPAGVRLGAGHRRPARRQRRHARRDGDHHGRRLGRSRTSPT